MRCVRNRNISALAAVFGILCALLTCEGGKVRRNVDYSVGGSCDNVRAFFQMRNVSLDNQDGQKGIHLFLNRK